MATHHSFSLRDWGEKQGVRFFLVIPIPLDPPWRFGASIGCFLHQTSVRRCHHRRGQARHRINSLGEEGVEDLREEKCGLGERESTPMWILIGKGVLLLSSSSGWCQQAGQFCGSTRCGAVEAGADCYR